MKTLIKLFSVTLLACAALTLMASPVPPKLKGWDCTETYTDDGNGGVSVTTDCTYTEDPPEDPWTHVE